MERPNSACNIDEDISNATLEAIYWWNRDEYFYHKYFSRLEYIKNDNDSLEFFTRKIFEVFLKEYSVRRNISAGTENVKKFIEELFEYDFVKCVKQGDTGIIDSVSRILKENQNSTKRNTKSLLSKVAFLINPYDFSLYDSLAKESIGDIQKERNKIVKSQLEDYSTFIVQTRILIQDLDKKKVFDNSMNILNQFNGSEAHSFFSKSENAFKMRIIDKYLWLYSQRKNDNIIDNKGYLEIYKI